MTTTFTANDICTEQDAAARPASRPYWQDQPCPPWCSDRHSDDDEGADRLHLAFAAALTLTLEDPVTALVPGQEEGSRELIAEPSGLEVYIRQDYRESEPHLKVNLQLASGMLGARFTLGEARQLIENLEDAVRQASESVAS
jgi:hypothetical protein